MTEGTPISVVKRAVESWREEVARRRQVSQHDPVAEGIDYCAADILERIRPLEDPTRPVTPEQYASDHHVTPQTVRGWIRRGELEAHRGAHGWEIPRTARRRRKTA